MIIGLIFPSESEFKPILDRVEIRKARTFKGLEILEASYKGLDLVAAICGVCKVNAAFATQLLINEYGPDKMINVGVCGGLDFDTKLFDVVFSEKVYYHDVDANFLTKEFPFMEDEYFKADQNLVDLAKDLCEDREDYKLGASICGENFITDKERPDLINRFNAYSVDMETGAVAHICYLNDLGFFAIRAVTDDANHSGIEFFRDNVKKASEKAVQGLFEILDSLDKKHLYDY